MLQVSVRTGTGKRSQDFFSDYKGLAEPPLEGMGKLESVEVWSHETDINWKPLERLKMNQPNKLCLICEILLISEYTEKVVLPR